MIRMRRWYCQLAAILAGLALGTPLAVADEQEQGADERDRILEEVIVVAQKRSENVQDVPIAISTFSAETMEAERIFDFSDLVGRVPSLSVNTYSRGIAFPALRGAAVSQPSITGGQSVGLVVDDVAYTTSADWDLSLYEIEQMEVLRGPQGTLFGRNVVGGLINVRTKRPADEFGGQVTLTVGDYDLLEARGLIDIPLGEAWRTNISFYAQDSSGTSFNRTTGNDVNATDKYGLRGMAQYQGEKLEALFTAEYVRDKSGGVARDYVGPPSELDPDFMPDGDTRVVDQQFDGDYDMESWMASAKFTYATSVADFVSISAFRTREQYFFTDMLGIPVTPFTSANDVDVDQFTQEFRLVSNGGGRLTWTVGAFYMDLDLSEDTIDHYSLLPFTYLGELQSCLRLGSDSSPLCEAIGLPPGIPGNPDYVDDITYNAYIDGQTKSYAGYAQATYALTDKLNLTGGIRYTYEDVGSFLSESGPAPTRLPEGDYAVNVDDSFDDWAPKVAIDYAITPDHMVYATVSKGFKSGAFVHNGTAELTSIPVDPEIAWNYEIGAKTVWSNRVRLNASAFKVDYTDQQVFYVDDVGNPVVDNAGEVNVKGFEVELETAVTENLYLWLMYSYLDGKVKNLPDIADGNEPAQTPPHAASFGGVFNVPLASGSLSFRASAQYKSDYYLEVTNEPQFLTNWDYLIDASISYLAANERYRVSLWGKNLTDETVIVYGQDLAQFFYLSIPQLLEGTYVNSPRYNEPRTYGVSLQIYF